MNNFSTQMSEKLGGARNAVRRSDGYYKEERNAQAPGANVKHGERSSRFALPPADSMGDDGKQHINVWERAATEFGIILDQFQDTPFEHSMYGRFRSIEGFWHYLRSPTRDDRNRATYGFNAKKLGGKNDFVLVENFRYIIMDATWQKIKQYPAIAAEMIKSTLPFDMYFLHNNDQRIRIRPKSAFWMVPGLEEIRKALCENREPNFDFLLDDENSKRPDLSSRAVKHKAAKLTGAFTAKPVEEAKPEAETVSKDSETAAEVPQVETSDSTDTDQTN